MRRTVVPLAFALGGCVGIGGLVSGQPADAGALDAGLDASYEGSPGLADAPDGGSTATGDASDAAGPDADASVAPPADLVGWYRFEEMSGTTAKNSGSAGASLDAFVGSGVVLAAQGKLGKAFSFDGTSPAVVTVSGSTQDPGRSLDFTGPFTIETWIAPTVANNAAGIVSKMFNGIPAAGYFLEQNSSGGYVIGRACLSPCATPAAPGGSLQVGVFQHVALVYDGAAITIFLNAAAVSTSVASGAVGTNNIPVTIGFDDYGGFRGRIDEVKFWKVARTAAEICVDAGGTLSAPGSCFLP